MLRMLRPSLTLPAWAAVGAAALLQSQPAATLIVRAGTSWAEPAALHLPHWVPQIGCCPSWHLARRLCHPPNPRRRLLHLRLRVQNERKSLARNRKMQALYFLLCCCSIYEVVVVLFVSLLCMWALLIGCAAELTLQLCQVTVLLAMELLLLVQRVLVVHLVGTHAIAVGASPSAVFDKRIRLEDGLLCRLPVHVVQLRTAAKLYTQTRFIKRFNRRDSSTDAKLTFSLPFSKCWSVTTKWMPTMAVSISLRESRRILWCLTWDGFTWKRVIRISGFYLSCIVPLTVSI